MLTKTQLNRVVDKVRLWLEEERDKGIDSIFYKKAKSYLRGNNFFINYENAFDRLENIKLEYEDIIQNWAETDGFSITINSYYDWDDETLKKTLIHESLHFIILRDGRHEISENKEHNIMRSLNQGLVDY